MGNEVIILQTNPCNLQPIENTDGISILRINSPIGKILYGLSPETCHYLKNHINTMNPDIVHIHGYHTLFSLGIINVLKKQGYPIVFSPHYGTESHSSLGGRFLWSFYNITLGKKIIDFSDKIICASNYEKNNIQRTFNLPPNKIEIIAHGVDAIDLNKSFTIKKQPIRLLFIGYLLPTKGIQYILYALHQLLKKYKQEAELKIIGQGPYYPKLIEIIRKLSLETSISWQPFLKPSEVYLALKNADITLLLSESENYGIVVTESLAMGTPVIVAKRSALIEFLNEPGCYGIDFPPDPNELAELIINIYNSGSPVGPFSKKIRLWSSVTEDYLKVYKQLKQNR
jgi:glycosyltransferase involved in cell wall biosynthesis